MLLAAKATFRDNTGSLDATGSSQHVHVIGGIPRKMVRLPASTQSKDRLHWKGLTVKFVRCSSHHFEIIGPFSAANSYQTLHHVV